METVLLRNVAYSSHLEFFVNGPYHAGERQKKSFTHVLTIRMGARNRRPVRVSAACASRGREVRLKRMLILCVRALDLVKSHRDQLRNSRLLHGDAVQHGRDAHGFFAVRDEHELRL